MLTTPGLAPPRRRHVTVENLERQVVRRMRWIRWKRRLFSYEALAVVALLLLVAVVVLGVLLFVESWR